MRKCLEKSPDDRRQNAGGAATELRWIAEAPEAAAAATQRRGARLLPSIIAAAAVIGGIVAAYLLSRRESAKEPLRLTFSSNADRIPFNDLDQELVVSRDGRYVMYIGVKGGQSSLWLRDLRNATAAPIPNTEGAVSPFWSSDSRHVAFVRDGKLLRVTIAGEDMATICAVPPGTYVHGTWGHDGTVVISYLGQRLLLLRVPASGGTPQDIVPRDAAGDHVLLALVHRGQRPGRLLDGPGRRRCRIARAVALRRNASSPRPDRLARRDRRRLHAVRPARRALRPESRRERETHRRAGVAAVGRAQLHQHRSATFSASPSLLAFAGSDIEARATWFDRGGTILGTIGPNAIQGKLRTSRDGRKLVLSAVDPDSGTSDLWVSDLARNTSMRITDAWSPDDQTLAYSYEKDGPPHVYTLRATGGQPAMITERRGVQTVSDWSPDGKVVLFFELNAATKHDLFMVEPKPGAKPVPWLQTPFFEGDARFSPDGNGWPSSPMRAAAARCMSLSSTIPRHAFKSRWAAAMPRYGARGDRSSSSARMKHCSRRRCVWSGRSMPERRSVCSVRPGGADWGGYDVTADGQRILIARTTSGPQTNPINVIVNWKSLLEKK